MHNEDNLENKSPEECEVGFTSGMLIAGVIVACILAIIVTITLKVMKWIWLL